MFRARGAARLLPPDLAKTEPWLREVLLQSFDVGCVGLHLEDVTDVAVKGQETPPSTGAHPF